ncbi:MAG: two pore domain potassium channel family protein [Methanobacteriales archaeon]|nr:two pore domain potassium channel family protein [Methanobacteriales archaeon]MBC7117404.1 two pore domain potassium channel family protein [Methanobacteriaceae archaeon]
MLQTLTTVDYGEITPVTILGRLTSFLAMLSAIVITSLITASATSTLIEKMREEREKLLEKKVPEKELMNYKDDLKRSKNTTINSLKS